MSNRISPTLAICAIAGLIAAIGLFRPANTPAAPAPAAAPATVAAAAPGSTWAAGDPAAPAATAAPAAAAVAPAAVTIADFAFGGTLTVQAGQAIAVTNADGAPHTFTATDGAFDTGILDPGGAGQLTAPAAGSYSVFCALHPSMTTTLTVSGG